MGTDMDVFSFCGMPGCGKGVISDHLMKRNIPIFSMGDTVREHFQRDHPERPPEETGQYANEQRELHGKDIWARRLIERIEKAPDDGPSNEIDMDQKSLNVLSTTEDT